MVFVGPKVGSTPENDQAISGRTCKVWVLGGLLWLGAGMIETPYSNPTYELILVNRQAAI